MDDIIAQDKKTVILENIKNIERRYQIHVLHAIESGSRAWGFPSADSDYDVRIIYCHDPSWYVTAFSKKDHIEMACIGDLDIAGWDIAKCLRLLYKGNAVIHEWLNSPVVYTSSAQHISRLLEHAQKVFNPKPAFHHYLSLAYKKLSNPKTRLNAKSFLYGLRALLCSKWIVEYQTAPPVWFPILVERYLTGELKSVLAQLLEEKKHGNEQGENRIGALIWDFS